MNLEKVKVGMGKKAAEIVFEWRQNRKFLLTERSPFMRNPNRRLLK